MTVLHVGFVVDRPPGPRLAERMSFFELSPRAPIPKLATLAKYGKSRKPSSPKLAFVAPRSAWLTPQGPMRPGKELDAGIDWLLRASDASGSFAIVLATGAEITVGERDRELAAKFIERLKPSGRQIVFAPRGLWQLEQAAPFARSLGVSYGFDPLEEDAPGGDIAYARVRPMGARSRLSDGHLLKILERVISSPEAYVSFESEQGMRSAKRLLQLAAEMGDSDDAGEAEDDEAEDHDDGVEDEGSEGDDDEEVDGASEGVDEDDEDDES
jgi:hypothetical protein